MDDLILTERLRNKDIAALEEIIDQYTKLLTAVICNIACGNLTKQDVEEAVQDTFLSLWYNADKVENGKMKAYLCQIAKNKARDKLRTLSRNKTICIDDMVSDGVYVSDDIEEKTLSMAIDEALSDLGEPDREIIIRRYYYYQSSNQISEIMGINSQTIRTKLARAKNKLKKILTERGIKV